MALSIMGMLLPAIALADDWRSVDTDAIALPAAIPNMKILLSKPESTSRWQTFHANAVMAFYDDWTRPIVDSNFRISDALPRIGKLRRLSLLTFAETEHSRLFFGVNEKGVVGIHVVALPRRSDDRTLEIVRMPYLDRYKSNSDLQQLINE
jgi:hypothetical protein